MPRKKHLKILGFNYEVKVVEPNEMNESFNGICDDTKLILLIKKNKVMLSTFIHEIIEALNTNFDWQLEHTVLVQMETALRAILIDNKLLDLKRVKYFLTEESD